MTHILLTAVNSVFPIVTVIFVGYILRQIGFLNESFLKTANKLVFRILLPTMLFLNVYKIEDTGIIPWDLIGYSCVALLLIFALASFTAGFFTQDSRQKGVLVQAAFRSNTAVIGVTLAGTLGGDDAVAIAAILTAFSVPILNTLAVIALSMFVGENAQRPSIKNILVNIAKNPLIDGIALGFVCLIIRNLQVKFLGEAVFTLRDDVKFLYTAISNLGAIASPLALLVLGGEFNFGASGKLFKQITVGTLYRVILAPAIAIGGAYLLTRAGILHCRPMDYPGLIALFGTPAAVSSAIMAAEMKNDEQLATQIVVWSSILSIATIFGLICLLMSVGLLTP